MRLCASTKRNDKMMIKVIKLLLPLGENHAVGNLSVVRRVSICVRYSTGFVTGVYLFRMQNICSFVIKRIDGREQRLDRRSLKRSVLHIDRS